MTLNLISAHIHDVLFSYAEIKGDDYEIRGYFCLEKGKPLSIPKDSYCFLKCKKCFYDLYPNKYDFIKLRIKKSENSDNLEEYFGKEYEKHSFKFYKINKDNDNDNNDNNDNYIYIGKKEDIKNFQIDFSYIKKNAESQNIKDYDMKLKKLEDENKSLQKIIEILNKDKEEINGKFLKMKVIQSNNDETFDKKEGYDIVIDITSMYDLISGGWEIKYPKGKEEYERKMKMDTIVIGVIGNRNKGKSFILQKLSGYEVPQGYSVVTEGLSIKYGEEEDHCIAILDSAGKETPLLNPKLKPIITMEENTKTNEANEIKAKKDEENFEIKKEKSYEICLRDKLITETYIQKFIIDTSHILILVVGNINLNEQKLLENIKSLLKKEQYLYVIHNLIESYTKEQVNNYIEEQLKNLFGIKLKEINFQNNKGDYHQKYYVEEENEKVTHLIYVNEYSSIADYYNTPTIKFLKTKNNAEQRRIKFSVVEACKEYLEKIGDKFIEEKITKSKFENDNHKKIKLKDSEQITLKRVFVDEIGKTVTNTFDQPNYSYYTTDKDLIIKVEVPGEGADLKTKMQKGEEFYTFFFEGTKPCDESVINEKHKIQENLKNKNKIKFSFYISIKDITIGANEKGRSNFYDKTYKDGIFTLKYHLVVIEESEYE
jgi:hypothetical protein